eukprot:7096014-Pyramimonas_sp.AAC.1
MPSSITCVDLSSYSRASRTCIFGPYNQAPRARITGHYVQALRVRTPEGDPGGPPGTTLGFSGGLLDRLEDTLG